MIGKVVILFFLFYRNRSSLTTANSAESILNGIFNCSPKLLSEISVLQWPHGWPYVVLRRPGKCKTSNLRVIKTIRVRKEDLEPWILKSDIQARQGEMSDDHLQISRWCTLSEILGLLSRQEQQIIGTELRSRQVVFASR